MKLTFDDGREIVLSQELSEQLENVVNEATKEMKDTGFDEFGKKYYSVMYDGRISVLNNYNEKCDVSVHNALNAFTTEEFAEKIAFKQLMERKLLKFSLEHDGDKVYLKDEDDFKYYIYSDSDNILKPTACSSCVGQGEIYFYSEEIAQAAIEEFHDDLIKYFQLDFSK